MKRYILGALCDLDGVIFKTAKVHAKAWKELFDDFFQRYEKDSYLQSTTFDIVNDYIQFIDGKPRKNGIKDYLQSKKIQIPIGSPEDQEIDTVYGLAYKKNQIYRKLIREQGVEIKHDNLEKLREWKQAGMKLAVVSASENCQYILEITGLSSFFETRVDALVAEELHLLNKPSPDVFLYAASKLAIPEQSLMVLEDSIVGIEAAKKGGFGLVVGIAEEPNLSLLEQTQPDALVKNLGELNYVDAHIRFSTSFKQLPEVFDHLNELEFFFQFSNSAVFLDYDGTLTPIVANPENAVLGDSMREIISELSAKTNVIIISGRDKDVIRDLVGLENISYAGDHGLDMEEGNDIAFSHENLKDFMPHMEELRKKLLENLLSVSGIKIERKMYTTAIHYRNVDPDNIDKTIKTIEHIVQEQDKFKIVYGKKVLDICPNINWDKGKAVYQIISQLQEKMKTEFASLYIGDDLTDEHAFYLLPNHSIGILVGEHGQKTYADFRLKNTKEVENFLRYLSKGL